MADTPPLPSREEMQDWMNSVEQWELVGVSGRTIAAVLSGRLVDREAIDRARIEEILRELCKDWYDMVIREGKTFDFGAAMRALDAALGRSDG